MNIQILKTAALRRMLAVSAVALLGTSAMAQTATPSDAPPPDTQAAQAGRDGGPRGAGPRFDPKRAEQFAQRREAEIKAKLQITAAQEEAWKTWVAAIRHERPQGDPAQARAEYEAMAKLTTPERIDRQRALRAQRDLKLSQREDATKAFYASLQPEQQKVFDTETQRGPGPGPEDHGEKGPARKGGERQAPHAAKSTTPATPATPAP